MTQTRSHKDKTAALLIIGAEILSGKIADANGPFLLQALRERGIEVCELRVIGDDVTQIANATRALSERADYVLSTGGIGPTHDDQTMAGIAAAFGVELYEHPDLLRNIQQRYAQVYGPEASLPHAVRRLAHTPKGASVRFSPPPPMVPIVTMHNVTILPGVPSLARTCFQCIAPMFSGRAFYTRTLFLIVQESQIAQTLTEIQQLFPDVAIGSYPNLDTDTPEVRITVDGRDITRVQAVETVLLQRLPGATRVNAL